MNRTQQKILLFFLIIFSIYCALLIGQSWDEGFHLIQGKITLNYLLSLGNVNESILHREYYSPMYWSLLFIITQIFPSQYQIEISHLVNLFFALGVISGIAKLNEEIFNKKVGKIIFLILFFYPIFFGHMAFNNKDTILAFSHVWIAYLILRYLKKQNIETKTNVYVYYIALLAALATGIQIIFLGSLIPVILFVFIDIFLFKKIVNKNFNNKKFFFDLAKCFGIFYFLLIFFWIDAHSNIFTLPFNIIINTFSENFWSGWPFNLVNGNYYIANEIPKSYLLINLFYKSPEYILLSYLFFVFIIIKSNKFYEEKFKFFKYKISLIFAILLFPSLTLFVIPHFIYDGMRLFLWALPYYCVIPGLTIYYLVENFKYTIPKIAFFLLSVSAIYFMFIFFTITPYQYTYLNSLNGKKEERYKRFENDYWGSSLKELIKNATFDKSQILQISDCGINVNIAKNYFKKEGYTVNFVNPDKAKYIIMTNRTLITNTNNNELKLTNCFDKFVGDDLFTVKRNGLILSVIRKFP